MQSISLTQLDNHPHNSNVMPDRLLTKLKTHIQTNQHYPPLIVRPIGEDEPTRYQIIDGHHRAQVLRELGHEQAQCVVWEVDDDQTLILLATLNRLEGADDPRKRAVLVRDLSERFDVSVLAKQLPEEAGKLKKLMKLSEGLPPVRPPVATKDMPVPVHFFLLPQQRRQLEKTLKDIGPTREEALMSLIEQTQATLACQAD